MSEVDRRYLIGAGIAGAALVAKLAHAGPLNPPAGPVATTGKTLDNVEPRTAVSSSTCPGDQTCLFHITAPGSYYLTAGVAAAGTTIVRVSASGVTLDCRGFTLNGAGNAVSPPSPACIAVDDGLHAVDVFDAVCRDAVHGVQCGGACVSVSDVDCSGCTTGIEVGPGSSVDDCRATTCVQAFACTAGPDAAAVGGGTTFTECIARACGTGFACADGTCIDDCVACECDAGVACGDRCFITNTCVIRASSASSTGAGAPGISVGAASECDSCCVIGATGPGIVCGVSSSIDCCVCCRCGSVGADCADKCDVSDCTFNDNAVGGVSVAGSCRVFDCCCDGNGNTPGLPPGYAIACESGCSIEDNTCRNSPVACRVGGTGSLVISNMLRGCPSPVVMTNPNENSIGAIVNAMNNPAFQSNNHAGNMV